MREAQLLYAATDAYCLIEVYDKLAENCHAKCIPFPPNAGRTRNNNAASKKADKREWDTQQCSHEDSTPGTPPNAVMTTITSGGAIDPPEKNVSSTEAAKVTNGFHEGASSSSEEPSSTAAVGSNTNGLSVVCQRQASFETDSLPAF